MTVIDGFVSSFTDVIDDITGEAIDVTAGERAFSTVVSGVTEHAAVNIKIRASKAGNIYFFINSTHNQGRISMTKENISN